MAIDIRALLGPRSRIGATCSKANVERDIDIGINNSPVTLVMRRPDSKVSMTGVAGQTDTDRADKVSRVRKGGNRNGICQQPAMTTVAGPGGAQCKRVHGKVTV
jgi:hypothetical protein